ncbi:hypothetical protein Bca4012_086563 [Brassica carinata]
MQSSGSRLEVVWTSWKFSDKVVWTSRKSSGLLGSRLDFQEVVWTSGKSSGLPGSRLNFMEIWKTSGTTYLLVVWKSSGLLGSLLTKSSGLPVKSSGLPVKSSGLPVKSLEVAQLPKSLTTKSPKLLEVVGLLRSRLDLIIVVCSCLLKWNPSLSL